MRIMEPGLVRAVIDAFHLPDLRARILFTLAMLVVFRFIAHVPIPGADLEAMRNLFERNQLLGMLDIFSGGAMRNLSIAAMGVYPYITAIIIMQLLTPIIPRLRELSQEGEWGRQRINQITHWITAPLASLQAYGQLSLLQSEGVISGVGIKPPFLLTTIAMIVSMTAGTMFLVWLGELITQRGIGNGVSIIIFGGIVARLPEMIGRGFIARENIGGLLIFTIIGLLTVGLIVIFTVAHRRIPVQFSRSIIKGGRVYRQSGSSYIPLRVNMAGMIPLIFAMSVIMFPGYIASYFARSPGAPGKIANSITNLLSVSGWFYWLAFFWLVVGFTFFYTMIIYEQMNLTENLRRQGGFIPGLRPGISTEQYLSGVIRRITWAGALFLGFVAVIPFICQQATNIAVLQLSTISLLIVVGVVIDTMRQLEAQLLMRHYEGFLR